MIHLKKLSLLLIYFFVLSTCSKNPDALDLQTIPRSAIQTGLVGKPTSKNTNEGRATVFIQQDDGDHSYTICTGTLIHPQVVLTAGHCLFTSIQSYKVFWTDQYPESENANFNQLGIEQFIVHPYFTSTSSAPGRTKTENDIALIFLQKPAPKKMQVAQIENAGQYEKPGQEFMALGFGAIQFNDRSLTWGNGLRSKKLKILSLPSHHQTFNVEQKDGGLCKGDSGGPAFITDSDGLHVIGVAKNINLSPPQTNLKTEQQLSIPDLNSTANQESKSKKAKDKNNYCALWAQYTSVSYYKDWIQLEIQKRFGQ